MAINWGNVTGNVQDSSGNKPGGGGNTSGGTGNNTPGGGGPHGGGASWGSGSSSSNGSSGNTNQNSPGHPSGGYNPNKNEVVDPRSYAASGQAQSDYEDSLPAEPELTGLDALIANKDKLKNIPAGNGLNQYQVEMEKFKNSPGGLALFKKRFPNPLVKIAQGLGSYIKKGGVIGILANALGGSKDAASKFTQNASTMAKDIGSLLGLDSLMTKNLSIAAGGDNADFSNLIKGQQAYDPSGLEGYRDLIMDMVPPIYGEDYIYDKSYMLPGAMEEAVLAGSEPYSNFKPEISSNTSTDQQEVARDDEKLNNLLIDLGVVGDQPLSSVTEEVSETNYQNPEFMGVPNNYVMNDYEQSQLGEGNSKTFPNTNFASLDPNINPEVPFTEYTDPWLMPPSSSMHSIPTNANGGYMSSFPNQNLNTESLSASDNIDDRIMKNLEFEKMAPGMMGYNSGGKVMSTYDKLKAIADNNYG